MTTHTDMIIRICENLVKVGKKPSIGLVKTKLTAKVPLAEIIRAIQVFESNQKEGISLPPEVLVNTKDEQSNIDKLDENAVEKCSQCKHHEQRLLQLEAQVQNIQQTLINLQAQVKG